MPNNANMAIASTMVHPPLTFNLLMLLMVTLPVMLKVRQSHTRMGGLNLRPKPEDNQMAVAAYCGTAHPASGISSIGGCASVLGGVNTKAGEKLQKMLNDVTKKRRFG
jgi:hypothetical protein